MNCSAEAGGEWGWLENGARNCGCGFGEAHENAHFPLCTNSFIMLKKKYWGVGVETGFI